VSPARWVRDRPGDDRLLAVDVASGSRVDAHVRDLPSFLRAGDLVVLNDAATLPASLQARVGDRPLELRLASRIADGVAWAVAFGEGDWRTPTDAIYTGGRPIQYSHVDRDLPLWAVQTPFATRPWAVEMPSAGRSFGPAVITALRGAGVAVAWLTHAAGLSSTGDAAIDAMLPLAEDYEIPVETARAVEVARAGGGRVIAMGTTVVRALESASATGHVVAGAGTATLKLDPAYRRRVVDGIVTGFHQEGSSHLRLLAAFAPKDVLASTYAHAERAGYLCHELGDVNLVIAA
jgi:S-adenosylmethionine:tRNA ribosyltransferase-isomerase